MTALYYGKLTPQNATATTAAAGFPASNVLLESLGRPWRSTVLGDNAVDLVLPAATMVKALELHDINFTGETVQKSPDGVTFTVVAAQQSYRDRHGRYRSLIVIDDANTKVVRIFIGNAGASLNGKSYWHIGAAHLFSSKVALSVAPVYPLPVRTKRPRQLTTIPNGVPSVASTGLNIDRVTLGFTRRDVESLDTLIEKATAGTCVLDAEYSPYPEQVWPVRLLEEDFEEVHSGKRISNLQVVLTEVVASP